MAREQLGDVFFDLIAEVTKHREALCDAKFDGVVESAHAAARALAKGLKNGDVPARPETLRKVRSAQRKLKAELEYYQGAFEDDELEVETEPPNKKPKKKAEPA